MVVASVYYLYGFELNQSDLDLLVKLNILDVITDDDSNEDTDSDEYADYKLFDNLKIKVIKTPHSIKWANFKENTYYIGECQVIFIDPSKTNPFRKLNKNVFTMPLKQLFSNVKNIDPSVLDTNLIELLNKNPMYNIIPTDCHCCS